MSPQQRLGRLLGCTCEFSRSCPACGSQQARVCAPSALDARVSFLPSKEAPRGARTCRAGAPELEVAQKKADAGSPARAPCNTAGRWSFASPPVPAGLQNTLLRCQRVVQNLPTLLRASAATCTGYTKPADGLGERSCRRHRRPCSAHPVSPRAGCASGAASRAQMSQTSEQPLAAVHVGSLSLASSWDPQGMKVTCRRLSSSPLPTPLFMEVQHRPSPSVCTQHPLE